jgi:hypothetical protein
MKREETAENQPWVSWSSSFSLKSSFSEGSSAVEHKRLRMIELLADLEHSST